MDIVEKAKLFIAGVNSLVGLVSNEVVSNELLHDTHKALEDIAAELPKELGLTHSMEAHQLVAPVQTAVMLLQRAKDAI